MTTKKSVIVISEDEDGDEEEPMKPAANVREKSERPSDPSGDKPKYFAKRSRFKTTGASSTDSSQRDPDVPVIQSITTLRTTAAVSNDDSTCGSGSKSAGSSRSARSSRNNSQSFPFHFSQSEFSYAGADFEIHGSNDDRNPTTATSSINSSNTSTSKSNGQLQAAYKSLISSIDPSSNNRSTAASVGKNTIDFDPVRNINGGEMNRSVTRNDTAQTLTEALRRRKLALQAAEQKKTALIRDHRPGERPILPLPPATAQQLARKRKLGLIEDENAKKSRPIVTVYQNIKPRDGPREAYERVDTHIEQMREHAVPETYLADYDGCYASMKENLLQEGMPKIIYETMKHKLDESYETQARLLRAAQATLAQLFDERKKEIEAMKNELRTRTDARTCSIQKEMDLFRVIQSSHMNKQREILDNIKHLEEIKAKLEVDIQEKRMILRLANSRLARKQTPKSLRRVTFCRKSKEKLKKSFFISLRKHVKTFFNKAMSKYLEEIVEDNEKDNPIINPRITDVGIESKDVNTYVGVQDGYARHLLNLFYRIKDRTDAHIKYENQYKELRDSFTDRFSVMQETQEKKFRNLAVLQMVDPNTRDEVLKQFNNACEKFSTKVKKSIHDNLSACRQRFYRQSLGLSHELQIQCENFYRALWDCQPNLDGGDNFEAIVEQEEVNVRSEHSRHLMQLTSKLNWIRKKRKECAQTMINSKISFLHFQQQLARENLTKESSIVRQHNTVSAIIRALRHEMTVMKKLEEEKKKKAEMEKNSESLAIDLTGDDSGNEDTVPPIPNLSQVSPANASAVLVPIITTAQFQDGQSVPQSPARLIMIAGNFSTQQSSNISGLPTLLIPQLNFAPQPVLNVTPTAEASNADTSRTDEDNHDSVDEASEEVANVESPNASQTVGDDSEIEVISSDAFAPTSSASDPVTNEKSDEDSTPCENIDANSTDSVEMDAMDDDNEDIGLPEASKSSDKASKEESETTSETATAKCKKRVHFELPEVEEGMETNTSSGVEMGHVDQLLYDIGFNLVQSQYIGVSPSLRGDPVLLDSINRLRWKSSELRQYTCNECDFIATCDTTLQLHKKTIHPPASVLFLPGPLPRIPEKLVLAKDLCVRFNNRVTPAVWEEKIECLWCETFTYWMPCDSTAEFPQYSLLARHHLLSCQDHITQRHERSQSKHIAIQLPRPTDLNFVTRPPSDIDAKYHFPSSPWSCELCNYIAESRALCRRHMRRCHPIRSKLSIVKQPIYSCRGCKAKFFTKEGALNHVIKRPPKRGTTRRGYACPVRITCPFCESITVSAKAWPMHMLLRHPKTTASRLENLVCPFCYPCGPCEHLTMVNREKLLEHLTVWHDMRIPNDKDTLRKRTLSTNLSGPLFDAYQAGVKVPRQSKMKMFDNAADECPFCETRVLLSRMVDHMKRCHIKNSEVVLDKCDKRILKPVAIGLNRICQINKSDNMNFPQFISESSSSCIATNDHLTEKSGSEILISSDAESSERYSQNSLFEIDDDESITPETQNAEYDGSQVRDDEQQPTKIDISGSKSVTENEESSKGDDEHDSDESSEGDEHDTDESSKGDELDSDESSEGDEHGSDESSVGGESDTHVSSKNENENNRMSIGDEKVSSLNEISELEQGEPTPEIQKDAQSDSDFTNESSLIRNGVKEMEMKCVQSTTAKLQFVGKLPVLDERADISKNRPMLSRFLDDVEITSSCNNS